MEVLRKTKSVCPVCLKNIYAELLRSGDEIVLSKICEEHGKFEAVVWRGEPNFNTWGISEIHNQKVLHPIEKLENDACIENVENPKNPRNLKNIEGIENSGILEENGSCPHNCGLCSNHEQRTCTVLLELTHSCNLHCPVCFADAGTMKNASDFLSADCLSQNLILPDLISASFTPLDTIREQLTWIRKNAGSIVLQLSGGEPTLYPYLREVVEAASQLFPAVQLNTNGLLLAEDENLARTLKEAGLSWVFLQCDGDSDVIHTQLRGRPLLDIKIKAIENCKKAGLSVVLVSVVVAGVNDDKLGDMLKFGLSFFPTVRGVHFQPMTLSGRNSFHGAMSHVTLPEIITKLSQQSHGMIKVEHAFPSSCEHTLCSFHCRYYVDAKGNLQYIRGDNACACDTSISDESDDAPERTIESVIRSWKGETDASLHTENGLDEANNEHVLDAFDLFIAKAKKQTFSVTCMAFQDVHTLDLERLQKCCVHVYDEQNRLIPFCAYNLTSLNGVFLYRN